ncbi:hypothetical protein BGW38_000736, partial [Lunasporangiospora selenospora]
MCLIGEALAQNKIRNAYPHRTSSATPLLKRLELCSFYTLDKYGRKVVMLFGLFMTSVCTLVIGVSTSYHDAMLGFIVQGACSGLVPVSKCAIGEIAARQQHIHDLEQQLLRIRRRLPQRQNSPRDGKLIQRDYHRGPGGDVDSPQYVCDPPGQETFCSDRVNKDRNCDMDNSVGGAESLVQKTMTKEDFAAKGYSGLVIALAIGAAFGPLIGGNLARRPVVGFEAFPFFAPCALVAAVGFGFVGIGILTMTETHPKWATLFDQESVLSCKLRAAEEDEKRFQGQDSAQHRLAREVYICNEPGQSQGREFVPEESEASSSGSQQPHPIYHQQCLQYYLPYQAEATGFQEQEARRHQEQQDGVVGRTHTSLYPPTALTTTILYPSAPISVSPPSASHLEESNNVPNPRKQALSPASELYLILTIYSLLVLTSILGSEFVMLYTQSPSQRGGLEFSAKALGEVLTIRGILKLVFTVVGYPWVVKRLGLLKCLRLGIVVIGLVSAMGLGWFVPWSVNYGNITEYSSASVTSGNGVSTSAAERIPVGMGAVLSCLGLISVGDVLGYVSVLVL